MADDLVEITNALIVKYIKECNKSVAKSVKNILNCKELGQCGTIIVAAISQYLKTDNGRKQMKLVLGNEAVGDLSNSLKSSIPNGYSSDLISESTSKPNGSSRKKRKKSPDKAKKKKKQNCIDPCNDCSDDVVLIEVVNLSEKGGKLLHKKGDDEILTVDKDNVISPKHLMDSLGVPKKGPNSNANNSSFKQTSLLMSPRRTPKKKRNKNHETLSPTNEFLASYSECKKMSSKAGDQKPPKEETENKFIAKKSSFKRSYNNFNGSPRKITEINSGTMHLSNANYWHLPENTKVDGLPSFDCDKGSGSNSTAKNDGYAAKKRKSYHVSQEEISREEIEQTSNQERTTWLSSGNVDEVPWSEDRTGNWNELRDGCGNGFTPWRGETIRGRGRGNWRGRSSGMPYKMRGGQMRFFGRPSRGRNNENISNGMNSND